MTDTSLKPNFHSTISTIYNLGITPKSIGFAYILDVILNNNVEDIDSSTISKSIAEIAECHNIPTRSVEDSIMYIFTNACDRPENDTLHKLFENTTKPNPDNMRKPNCQRLLTMMLLVVEAVNKKNHIFADFSNYCIKHDIELNF